MDKNVTSEEKLLKLIRHKGRGQQGSPIEEKKDTPPSGGEKKQEEKPKKDILRVTNRLLVILIIGILGLLLSKYFFKKEDHVQTASLTVSEKRKETVTSEIPLQEGISFASYQEEFSERDLFRSPWDKTESLPGTKDATSSDLEKQLKLVGIVLDRDPKAIVEDLKTKQTVFMSKGEEIAGAVLEEIHEDKVVFTYNDQTFELTP